MNELLEGTTHLVADQTLGHKTHPHVKDLKNATDLRPRKSRVTRAAGVWGTEFHLVIPPETAVYFYLFTLFPNGIGSSFLLRPGWQRLPSSVLWHLKLGDIVTVRSQR